MDDDAPKFIDQDKHTKFVEHYRENNPNILIGCTIFPSENIDMNDLYFNCADAYSQMIDQLIENGHIQEKENSIDYDFSIAGFPRIIPNLNAVEAVYIFIENYNGMLGSRVMFSYKGDSMITYQTSFIL